MPDWRRLAAFLEAGLTEYDYEPVSTLEPRCFTCRKRPRASWLPRHETLERTLDYDDWFIGEVESGLAQAETGQALTHEAVGARLSKRLAEYDSGR